MNIESPETGSSLPTTTDVPLRKLREAANLTQEQMAERLNTSVANIRAIEGGKRVVNRTVAKLAQARFGVFAESLFGKSTEPVTLLGERVSSESLERVILDAGVQRVSDKDIHAFTEPLTFLIKAAAYNGRMVPLGACYREMLTELANDLQISGRTQDEAHRFYKRPGFKEYTVKHLRENPAIAEAIGFEDDPDLPATAIWRVQSGANRKTHDWLHSLRSFLPYQSFLGSDGEIRYRDKSQESHPWPFVPVHKTAEAPGEVDQSA